MFESIMIKDIIEGVTMIQMEIDFILNKITWNINGEPLSPESNYKFIIKTSKNIHISN